VLVSDGDITGVIDWGDVAQGDRATDLAAVWMLFPEAESRKAVVAACHAVSENTWQRARGWALLLSLAVLEASDKSLAGAALQTMRRLLEPI
jgi:aminoglycoside phosphotransferase (APT) family kinase protein